MGKNSRKQTSYLLSRDRFRCGVHTGGCGERILSRADASVDHIFTKSFFRDREDSIKPRDYNQNWNCQPMHRACNAKRGGQIYGFPLFTCSCHWLQIDRRPKGHVLTLHYRTKKVKCSIAVSTEDHDFVFGNLSTGRRGEEFGGSSEIGVSGVWSMGDLKPGKKGMTGKSQLGHAFPRIDPEEVELFNQLEKQRVEGSSSETIAMFNRRMDSTSIKVYWESVESPD